MSNLFKNIPTVYYINSQSRQDLMEYTEKNLQKNGIFKYKRIIDHYNKSNYSEWNDLIKCKEMVNDDNIDEICLSVLIIDTIKKWIEETDEKMMILMSDTVDYEFTEYFHFDWEYLMNNIPYDWDSILLGFEDLLGVVPCFLHPVRDSHGTGVTLINRRYAKKLIKIHYRNEKFDFFPKISNNFWKKTFKNISPHYFLNQCGRSYAIPMFPRNPDLTTDKYFDKNNLEMNKKLHLIFWKKLRDKVPPEQFFSYFSSRDLYLNPKSKTISLYNNINKF